VPSPRLTVGLTGGLASGKSFVGKALADRGCYLIEADKLGHEVLQPGGAAHDAVLREFGTADRRELATLVFSHPERLAALNAIVHPAVDQRKQEILASFPDGIAVYAAAILIEIGTYKNYNCLILAYCTREQQIERAMNRPGATMEDVLARLARQIPLEEKRMYADYIIDTSGTKEDTLRQTAQVFDRLRDCLRNRSAII
jgi:dephospho-CoA kinase